MPRRHSLTGALLLLLIAGGTVPAQPPAAGGGAAPSAGSADTLSRWQDVAARAVVRVALVDLRALSSPNLADYRVASLLLGAASRLSPNDQDILRLAIDAAVQSADDDAAIALTRQLLKLDPADTVAQLRLITSMIGRAQDAAGRLALYDNFLGARGESLDASIRSRLALDAALLCREMGNTDGFVDRLRQSVKLDPTNKDAATLAYSFFAQRVDDPQARVEALITLMQADPADAEFHENMARELALGGAHAASLRFYRLALKINEVAQTQASAESLAQRLTQEWLVEGAPGVLKQINEQLLRQRTHVENMRKRMEEQGVAGRSLPDPAAVRATPDVEQVRIAAASATGDEATLDAAIADLAGSVATYREQATDPTKRPAGVPAELIASDAAFWDQELLWCRLWTGKQIDQAKLQIAELAKTKSPEDLEELNAALLLREGKLDEAHAFFAPRADKSMVAGVAMGVIAELRNDKAKAASIYGELYRRSPGSLIGAWARTKATALGSDPTPPESAKKLEAIAAGIPAWLDDVAVNPRRIETFSVSIPTAELAVGAKAVAVIRLRNTSPIALAFGPDRPLNSRLLVGPSASTPGVDLTDAIAPEVVNIDRRLRLMPREEVVVPLWLEPGYSGWAMEQATGLPIRLRWRIDQGFRLDSGGGMRSGGLGLSTETPGAVRQGPAGAADPIDQLTQRVLGAQDVAFVEVLAAVRARTGGTTPGAEKPTPEEFARLGAALSQRYGRETPAGRLLMLASLPTGRREPGMLSFDRAVRDVEETDADVILLKMVTRADEADSPIILKALASSDAATKARAEVIQARLKAGARGYARLTSTSIAPVAR